MNQTINQPTNQPLERSVNTCADCVEGGKAQPQCEDAPGNYIPPFEDYIRLWYFHIMDIAKCIRVSTVTQTAKVKGFAF